MLVVRMMMMRGTASSQMRWLLQQLARHLCVRSSRQPLLGQHLLGQSLCTAMLCLGCVAVQDPPVLYIFAILHYKLIFAPP